MLYAKPTTYNGITFRSRLEARWAVYFDCIGIKYEYEMERFDFNDGTSYLPDFYLPQVKMWAEVKPIEFDKNAEDLVDKLVWQTESECLKLVGSPQPKSYESICYDPMPYKEFCSPHLVHRYYILTNHYLFDESRFYSTPGYDDEAENFDDVMKSVNEAKNAFKFI